MTRKLISLSFPVIAGILLTACLGTESPIVASTPSAPAYPPPAGPLRVDLGYPPPSGPIPDSAAYPAPSGEGESTVAQVLANPTGFPSVTLRGEIIGQIEEEKYTFRDGTGSIQLEIDPDVSGQVVFNQTVLVSGDVELNDGVVQVEVVRIEEVQ